MMTWQKRETCAADIIAFVLGNSVWEMWKVWQWDIKFDKYQKHSVKNRPKSLKFNDQMQEIIRNQLKSKF